MTKRQFGKKRIIIVSIVALSALAIVGTIAYSRDYAFFSNLFHLGADVNEFTETFTSPQKWMTCDEVPKTAVATNKNKDVRYARMKINKYWRLNESAITDLDDHETSELSLTWTDGDGEHEWATVNYQNENDWVLLDDGWYYYKHPLEENQSTNSLLKSVTLNCDASLTDGYTESYSGSSHSMETHQSAYSNARFHLYVTMQLSSEEYELPENETLYDMIAKQSAGLDTNINFAQTASVDSGNGNGVNTFTKTKDDQYPVYYYRGEVANNVVLFNDVCWRIIRTTSTGGVKMLYYGKATNGQCLASTFEEVSIAGGVNMPYCIIENGWTNPCKFAGGVGYEHGNILINNGYNYNVETTPEQQESILSNWGVPSQVKTTVENWFTGNTAEGTNMATVADKLEDTPFCNDRSTISAWSGTNVTFTGNNLANNYSSNVDYHAINLDCPRGKVDNFTVAETSNGNGRTSAKAGLITLPEAVLAGVSTKNHDTYYNYFFDSGSLSYFWTMTPLRTDSNDPYIATIYGTSIDATYARNGRSNGSPISSGNSTKVRPVISLIHDTYVVSGEGTKLSPFILEW